MKRARSKKTISRQFTQISVFLSFLKGTKIKSLGLNILSLKSFVLMHKIGNLDDLYHDPKKQEIYQNTVFNEKLPTFY
jgi:hypothetical protein